LIKLEQVAAGFRDDATVEQRYDRLKEVIVGNEDDCLLEMRIFHWVLYGNHWLDHNLSRNRCDEISSRLRARGLVNYPELLPTGKFEHAIVAVRDSVLDKVLRSVARSQTAV
jgi:hypothetical protein